MYVVYKRNKTKQKMGTVSEHVAPHRPKLIIF